MARKMTPPKPMTPALATKLARAVRDAHWFATVFPPRLG